MKLSSSNFKVNGSKPSKLSTKSSSGKLPPQTKRHVFCLEMFFRKGVCVCVSVCPNQGFLVHKAWNSHEKLWTDGYVHGNLRAPPNAIPPQNWYVPNDGSFCQKVLERNFPIRSWWSALVSQAIKTPNDRGLQLMFRDMSELYSINPQTEFNWFVKRRNLKPPRIHVFHLDKNPCKRW